MTVVQKIADLAKLAPDAQAVGAPGERAMTYGELIALIADVQASMYSAGLTLSDTVALVLDNGPLAATAFTAISASAACAPLNPAFVASDFEFYLEDLNAKALVVDVAASTPAREAARKCGIPIIELQAEGTIAGMFSLQEQADADLTERRTFILPSPAAIALVLHTSGTTSRPKLVGLTQQNLHASAINVASSLDLTKDDCCLNVMPLFHIHGLVAAVLATLQSGGRVVCTNGLDANRFVTHWLPKVRPTWYTAVPTMHQALLQTTTERIETSLRFVRSSSASLPPTTMSSLEERFGAPVIEAYGMTEAAHQMASNPLPPLQRKPGTVGLAAGPEVAIMSESGSEILATEQIGEIVIRGNNVTVGYINNDAANESAFTEGWFRTGDQGCLDSDGYLRLTGRLKEIINRGGEKVAPREVDEAALGIDGIVQAVAFALKHPSLGEDIALAVVTQPDTGLTEASIRQQLFERLTPFKVPSRVIVVSQIPKGPTGKLQRIGLADSLAPQLAIAYTASRHPFDSILIEEIAQAIQVPEDEIGIHSNFFSLGGDSLQGAALMARLSEVFEVQLSGAELFENPTVASLHNRLRELLLSADPTNIELITALETLSAEAIQKLSD